MRTSKKVVRLSISALLCLSFSLTDASGVNAALFSTVPSKDNTLYEYDPADENSPFNSNGSGDFVSAGRTLSRGLLRRGLLQFDLSSAPAGAVVVPGTVELRLEVVDVPKKDTSSESRAFWLLPLGRSWGEGASVANAGVSGAGSGAAALAGDATWLHTEYDPAVHDPRNPNPVDPGYWLHEGALGNGPIDPTVYGSPAGIVPAAPYLGPVSFSSSSMEDDINAWLENPGSNFGWILVGDERIGDADRSSNRGFASREHADLPPMLSFEYRVVPEPTSILILLTGLVSLWLGRQRLPFGKRST